MEFQTQLSQELLPSIQRIRESRFKTGVREIQDRRVLLERHFRLKSQEERTLDVYLETHPLKRRIFIQRHPLNI